VLSALAEVEKRDIVRARLCGQITRVDCSDPKQVNFCEIGALPSRRWAPWNHCAPKPLSGVATPKERPMAKTKEATLQDLFSETLKDIYYAEKQILRALPKMAKEAASPELKQAFESHRDQTEGHVERLNQIFDSMGRPARGKTCEAILGIIDEAKEFMEDFKGVEALDAGLVASAQAVEHYEIARYGTLKTWANELGMKDASKLLDETLQEEIKTDQLLTKLATSSVNKKAA
jgi:ferritin-like metal-binding protein YciE